MPNIETYAGFFLTSSKLQLVEVSIFENQIELINLDEVFLNEEINFEKDKISKIGALLQSAYEEIQLKNQFNPKYVSFCLPLDLFSILQLPIDKRLSYTELLEDFKFQFSILFPFKQHEQTIKLYEISPNIFDKYDTALAFAIEKPFLDVIENFVKQNNLKLLFIDNPHTATNISILNSNAVLCKSYYLSIFIQKKFLSYILAHNQKIIKMKLFNYNRIGDLPDILNNEFNELIFSKISIESLGASFISGDEISPNLVSLLRKTLGFDFIIFNPFEKLKVNSNLFENKLFLKKYNSFAPALGVALRLN